MTTVKKSRFSSFCRLRKRVVPLCVSEFRKTLKTSLGRGGGVVRKRVGIEPEGNCKSVRGDGLAKDALKTNSTPEREACKMKKNPKQTHKQNSDGSKKNSSRSRKRVPKKHAEKSELSRKSSNMVVRSLSFVLFNMLSCSQTVAASSTSLHPSRNHNIDPTLMPRGGGFGRRRCSTSTTTTSSTRRNSTDDGTQLSTQTTPQEEEEEVDIVKHVASVVLSAYAGGMEGTALKYQTEPNSYTPYEQENEPLHPFSFHEEEPYAPIDFPWTATMPVSTALLDDDEQQEEQDANQHAYLHHDYESSLPIVRVKQEIGSTQTSAVQEWYKQWQNNRRMQKQQQQQSQQTQSFNGDASFDLEDEDYYEDEEELQPQLQESWYDMEQFSDQSESDHDEDPYQVEFNMPQHENLELTSPVVYRYFGRNRARTRSSNHVPFIVLGPRVEHWKAAGQVLASRGFSVMVCETPEQDEDTSSDGKRNKKDPEEDAATAAAPYTPMDGRKVVLAALEALKWKKAVLVGCDEGAVAALEAARALSPDRVAGLVLCGHLGKAEAYVASLEQQQQEQLQQELSREDIIPISRTPPTTRGRPIDHYVRDFIACPSTIVWDGDLYAVSTFRRGSKVAVSQFTGEGFDRKMRTVVVGGGRAPHRRLPEQFSWVLTRFVEENLHKKKSTSSSKGVAATSNKGRKKHTSKKSFMKRISQGSQRIVDPIVSSEFFQRVLSPEALLVSGRIFAASIIYITAAKVTVHQYHNLKYGVSAFVSKCQWLSSWQKQVWAFVGKLIVDDWKRKRNFFSCLIRVPVFCGRVKVKHQVGKTTTTTTTTTPPETQGEKESIKEKKKEKGFSKEDESKLQDFFSNDFIAV